ncbi:MAG: cardiolipin synthase [Acholeplasmatales bacterium]|jgi:cardiolipin synthase|nr:cardiolipin synthase [Acholeplasmataceae bacterium]MCK9233660.1 cardiolipin synthase [Acholeplasmataceae bacterium]MCK9288951.1 cardiolipin synthase [Acholeplasmataceae bacterium]MCK9427545.1 cardiolipin synthase [Acholeplasmataceae bacterium]MDY0115187.1 cardiolipin synthase [Acholeplasmatales bacterium]
MKRLLRFLTNKVTIIAFITLLQIIFFVLIVLFLAEKYNYLLVVNYGLSFIMVIIVLKSDDLPVYKMSWVVPMLVAPIFGGLFYLTFKPFSQRRKIRKTVIQLDNIRKESLLPYFKELPQLPARYQKQITYLEGEGWPYFANTNLTFLPSGEAKLTKVIEELKKAQKSIFLHYFILDEKGQVWNHILPILVNKINAGVDVRLLYDDFGTSSKVKSNFKQRMNQLGIKTTIFNPLKLRFQVSLNYRDHRKMIIIDNEKAFTGGINIADEYVNIKKKFGHWHDAAIFLEGDAVIAMTASFIEAWNLYNPDKLTLTDHLPTNNFAYDGYVIPYHDSPFLKNYTTKNLFTQMLYAAKDEIFITTPYFIVDSEIINTIKIQALSGVKVTIIIPKIPDKKFVYVLTKYYLRELVDIKNVYIYQYTPGFIHSKIVYIDGASAAIGTVNFDFRSFYLHFENTVWFYQSKTLQEIKKFLDETIAKSTQMSLKDLDNKNIFYRIFRSLLVGVSHLL